MVVIAIVAAAGWLALYLGCAAATWAARVTAEQAPPGITEPGRLALAVATDGAPAYGACRVSGGRAYRSWRPRPAPA
jgi:hypothetical protein